MRKKIIIHAGQGKTGTTSIQQTLKNNSDKVHKAGFFYSGLLFENLEDYKEDVKSVDDIFQKIIDKRVSVADIEVTLKNFLNNNTKIHSVVWINESIFTNFELFEPIIRQLSETYDIYLYLYLREPYSWLMSAYKQWGIKDRKSGDQVPNFSEWVKSNIDQVNYNKYLDLWSGLEDCIQGLIIKNYDDTSDVSVDFLTDISLLSDSSNIEIVRANTSSDSEMLGLYKNLYNAKGANLNFVEIENFFRRYHAENISFENDLTIDFTLAQSLLFDINEKTKHINEVYQLNFSERSEQEIRKDSLNYEAKLISFLLYTSLKQHYTISNLDARLKKLEEIINRKNDF